MNKPKKKKLSPVTQNKFSHVKMVVAAFVTTNTQVGSTAEIIYRNFPNDQEARNAAVMDYLRSVGVPADLVFDDFALLFDKAFPAKTPPRYPLPVFMDYDQDNCKYTAIVAAALTLDKEGIAAP